MLPLLRCALLLSSFLGTGYDTHTRAPLHSCVRRLFSTVRTCLLSFTGKALCWSVSWRCYSLLFNVFGITAHRMLYILRTYEVCSECPLHSPSLSAPRRSVRMKRTCPTVSRTYERASHKTQDTNTHGRLETSKYVAHGWMDENSVPDAHPPAKKKRS